MHKQQEIIKLILDLHTVTHSPTGVLSIYLYGVCACHLFSLKSIFSPFSSFHIHYILGIIFIC